MTSGAMEVLNKKHEDPPLSWRNIYKKVALRASERSPEGRILLTGIVLLLLYMASLSVCMLFAPTLAQKLIGITASNILFGRAAGMSMGYAFGFGHGLVIPLNMLIETTLVLLFYPLFVLSLKQLLVTGWLRKFVNRILTTAEQHQQKVKRYGIPGLAVFVWFPLTMTGPLVGCVIGYMIGLSPWVNMVVVLTSTYLAIISWAMLLRDTLGKLASFGLYGPLIVMLVFVGLFGLSKIMKLRKQRKRLGRG
jgi:uncharacterized membrane protein